MSEATMRHRPLAFGLLFMALSMLIEIALLVVCRLRIPQDNAIVAPILLIASPTTASWLCHYRRPLEFVLLSCLTIFFTLLLVLVFSRLTGISTGLFPPIVIRTAAGFIATLIVNRSMAPGRTTRPDKRSLRQNKN